MSGGYPIALLWANRGGEKRGKERKEKKREFKLITSYMVFLCPIKYKNIIRDKYLSAYFVFFTNFTSYSRTRV